MNVCERDKQNETEGETELKELCVHVYVRAYSHISPVQTYTDHNHTAVYNLDSTFPCSPAYVCAYAQVHVRPPGQQRGE